MIHILSIGGGWMKKVYYRVYQHLFKVAMYLMPWREPALLEGENSLISLAERIKLDGINQILIVTDKGIVQAGLMDDFLKELNKRQLRYVIYDQTVANPTVENINEAAQLYQKSRSEAILAFGGGSAIDCAKVAGARVVRPKKPVTKMKGIFKVRKKLPPFYVVPTTAGTGAEATLAAVFSNVKTKEKYPIMDLALIPDLAVLDPLLTVNLPPHITAQTGMDALTHAIEAYIGYSNTKETKAWAIEACNLIMTNLETVYNDGKNLEARAKMQRAAYLAGKAFTRAYVGNVHAIAHQLGGFYDIPHGLANAVVLPYVLESYGDKVYQDLANLYTESGLGDGAGSYIQKAENFIVKIKEMNHRMNIPNGFSEIRDEDVPLMTERALQEANPLYPVPKIFTAEDLSQIFYRLQETI